jgi:hypothetical protein
VGAFAALGWLLGGSLIPSRVAHVERVPGKQITSRLIAETRSTSASPLHVDLDVAPEPWATAWLSALAHAGRVVTWGGSPPAVAMSTEPLIDPNGGLRVDVAAPNGSVVALRDDASAIDSARVASLGATITTPIAVGRVHGDVRGQQVSSATADSTILKSIAVIGAAGWEGKYIVSALEERGWRVIAHFAIAPKVDVTEGGPTLSLDTSRVAAVIAIDSTIDAYGAAVDRFVRSGGGLVLAGSASSAKSVATLAPGAPAARTHPSVRVNDTIGLGTTGFYPVSALKENGVVLERRAEGIAVAARRVDAGRVVQVGYDDSWRWRMAGAAGSEAAHREWWSRVVASVAYAPSMARAVGSSAESAPIADLVERLGPARVLSSNMPRPPIDRRLWLTLIMVLLLAEWASRRLRGKR